MLIVIVIVIVFVIVVVVVVVAVAVSVAVAVAVVVVVEMESHGGVSIMKWLTIVVVVLEEMTSAKKCSLIFVRKMCVFVSRPTKIATLLRKNGETPKWFVNFLLEKHTFRTKIMKIVEDIIEKKLQQRQQQQEQQQQNLEVVCEFRVCGRTNMDMFEDFVQTPSSEQAFFDIMCFFIVLPFFQFLIISIFISFFQ